MAQSRDPQTDEARELLRLLQLKGVQIWEDAGGALRYRAVKGAMEEADKGLLRRRRDAILKDLRDGMRIHDRGGGCVGNVDPLSFTQLAHWNTYCLDRKRSACIIPLAVQLEGEVCISALRESAFEVIRRHGALRTRIVNNPAPVQCVSDRQTVSVAVERVAVRSGALSGADRLRLLLQAMPQDVDVRLDPLCGVRILKCGEKDCVLVMYMEHIISDGYSLAVALSDLLTLYRTEMCGPNGVEREPPLQYLDYSRTQRASHGRWLEAHGSSISRHFEGCGRVRIPKCAPSACDARSGWGVAGFRFSERLIALLHAASRSSSATLVMCTFISYAAFVMRWCEVSDMVLLFQSDGRTAAGYRDSIGYYAFPLYLRVELGHSARLPEFTKHVLDEYCSALEHGDQGWMESRVPRPEFTRNTCFNWLPRGTAERKIVVGPMEMLRATELSIDTNNLGRLERDSEPMMGIVGSMDEITGGVYYPRATFGDDKVRRFVKAFLGFAADLWSQPCVRISDIEIRQELDD